MKNMNIEIKKKRCRELLYEIYPNCDPINDIRLISVQSGILAEIVSQDINPSQLFSEHRKVFEKVIEFNKSLKSEEQFTIQRIFTYKNSRTRFCEKALLHTRPADYDGETLISYLSAGDAQIWMTKLDSEAILLGVKGLEFDILSEIKETEIFSVNEDRNYVEIAVLGIHRRLLSPLKRKDKTRDGFWVVEIE